MYLVFIFIALIVGPLTFVLMSTRSQRSSGFAEYHYAARQVGASDFVASSVAYALQVAVLTLFATWGFQFGFGAFWVPLFWGLGYVLLAELVRRGAVDSFLAQDKLGTIHQFLGNGAQLTDTDSSAANGGGQGVRAVVLLAAVVSLLGIAGPAMYEADFAAMAASRLIANAADVPAESSFIGQYGGIFFWLFLATAAVYMIYGGFATIVSTDNAQLAIGYSAFSAGLSLLLVFIAQKGSPGAAVVLLIILLVSSITNSILWGKSTKWAIRPLRRMLLLVAVFFAPVTYLVALNWIVISADFNVAFLGEFFVEQKLYEPFGIGTVTLVNLFIANLLFQLVDIGQWQRLGSLKYDPKSPGIARAEFAKHLWVTSAFSVISWVVAICFGMSLRYLPTDMSQHSFDEFASALIFLQSTGDVLPRVVVVLMVLAISSIMFSTVDSLIAAISFTVHNDVLGSSNGERKNQTVARFATCSVLLVCAIAYGFANSKIANFAEIIYASWSMQIGLFWVVLLALTRRPIRPMWSFLSIMAGALGALLPLFCGAPLSTYAHGAMLALGLSGVVVLVPFIIGLGQSK